ncbi:MAG: hypothetical protein AMXMBFR13_06770 [Phycisphaerae bacterium]
MLALLPGPDDIGSSEYRAIRECLADGLESLEEGEDALLHAVTMLDEFMTQAASAKRQLQLSVMPKGSERLLGVNGEVLECECEYLGYFHSGLPGVLAHVVDNRLPKGASVERCDKCQRYATDKQARKALLAHLAEQKKKARRKGDRDL